MNEISLQTGTQGYSAEQACDYGQSGLPWHTGKTRQKGGYKISPIPLPLSGFYLFIFYDQKYFIYHL